MTNAPAVGAARLSLPGTGRGDRAQCGGWGSSVADRRHDCLHGALDIPVHIVVPEAQDEKTVGAQNVVTTTVSNSLMVSGVPATIDLDHKVVLEADKIDDVARMRPLPSKVKAFRAQRAEMNPELHFLPSERLPEPSRLLVGHRALRGRTPPTMLRMVPPPRAGEGSASFVIQLVKFHMEPVSC